MGGINGFFISILQGIHSFVGNYGWSVVLFTLLIRFVLLPLDIKQRKSMRAMQRIQPMQMELQRKYGRDQEKYNKKLQELYRKENVKPLAGCLPMLISLPLLFIMFSAMRNLASEQSARMLLNLVQSMPALGDGTSLQAALSAIQIDLSGLSITPEQLDAILQGLTLSAEQVQAVTRPCHRGALALADHHAHGPAHQRAGGAHQRADGDCSSAASRSPPSRRKPSLPASSLKAGCGSRTSLTPIRS